MPSIAISRPYEAIYIVDPDLGEEQVNAITDRYKALVETNGGTVEKIDVWERRKLAYAIKGRTEGIYVVMQFTGVPSVEVELRRIFQISEDQLRAMIVKPEEGAVSAPPAAESPVRAAAPVPVPAPVPAVEDQPAPPDEDLAPTTEPEIDPVAAAEPPEAEAEPTEAEPTEAEAEATSAAPAA